MSPVQSQISFPVRKSLRRKTTKQIIEKSNDDNSHPVTTSRSTRSKKTLVYSSVDDVLLCDEKPTPRSKNQKTVSQIQELTPRKACIPCEEKLTPSKRRAKHDSSDAVSPTKLRAHGELPLSPSKRFDSNIQVQVADVIRSPSPSARKQLSMCGNGKENILSPRKVTLNFNSPLKVVQSSSRSKETVLSPRKSLIFHDTCKQVSSTDNDRPSRSLRSTPPKVNTISEPPVIMSPRRRLDLCDTKLASPTKKATQSPRKASSSLKRLVDNSPRKSPRKLQSPSKAQSPRKLQTHSPRKLLSPRKENHSKPTPQADIAEVFDHAKQALNTQQPDEVVCRDKEIGHIRGFLDTHVNKRKPGSLYISGAPGTGKTAVIKHLLEQETLDIGQKVFINSMTVKSPFTMYRSIATELLGSKAASVKNARSACNMIQKYLTSSGKMVLIVLDEMDQLDSKNQEVLYTIFEWPSLPDSRLVLIGIANALDLTDRILPRLNVRSEYKPELLHFAPYTKEQIVTVIESRLQQTPQTPGAQVLDKAAMMFCARKVSAVAGDMRKALDICRRSVELAQLSSRKSDLLKLKGGSLFCTPVSKVDSPSVGIAQVANVVNEVYGSANTSSQNSTFPLQQKLIVCTLLLMLKTSKLKELTLGKLHDSYCRVCKKRDVSPTDQSEFIGLCQLLETRGLISLKKAKDTRMMKISLKMDAKELEFALKDKQLISSVLDTGL